MRRSAGRRGLGKAGAPSLLGCAVRPCAREHRCTCRCVRVPSSVPVPGECTCLPASVWGLCASVRACVCVGCLCARCVSVCVCRVSACARCVCLRVQGVSVQGVCVHMCLCAGVLRVRCCGAWAVSGSSRGRAWRLAALSTPEAAGGWRGRRGRGEGARDTAGESIAHSRPASFEWIFYSDFHDTRHLSPLTRLVCTQSDGGPGGAGGWPVVSSRCWPCQT